MSLLNISVELKDSLQLEAIESVLRSMQLDYKISDIHPNPKSEEEINTIWSEEVENRISALNKNEIETVSSNQIFNSILPK